MFKDDPGWPFGKLRTPIKVKREPRRLFDDVPASPF